MRSLLHSLRELWKTLRLNLEVRRSERQIRRENRRFWALFD